MHGRFIYLGDRKLYVRGVTYGTFASRPGLDPGYPPPAVVEADFALMKASGINAVRTYTAPPLWLLDLAQEHSVFVMAGLAWEEHVAFLEERQRARSLLAQICRAVSGCNAHPALLCYAIGNEIPASIVRWHGYRRVERFLDQLIDEVRDAIRAGSSRT